MIAAFFCDVRGKARTLIGIFTCLVSNLSVLSAGEHSVSSGETNGFVNFTTSSFWYLYGFNWDTPFNPSQERDIVTFEHYDDHRFGDLFLFVDFANLLTSGRGDPNAGFDVYGEVSPRISLAKVTGGDYRFGPIKDIFIYSGTYELGYSNSLKNLSNAFGLGLDHTQARHLHGVALDFDVPGFAYSSLNFYLRDDLDYSGVTWQMTYTWAIPFSLGPLDFRFQGFADLAGREDSLSSQFHTSPQLIADIGEHLLGEKRKLYAGFEVDIWINEFGVKDQDDVVPQLLLSYQF